MYDVAIIGYGPVGAVLAGLLGRLGLSVAAFERDSAPQRLPRGVHFDGETMRIFQSAGAAERVAQVTRPSVKGMHFVNPEGRTLLIRTSIDGPGPHGWHNDHYFHQPDLEQALRESAAQYAGVSVFQGHAVEAVDDRGDRTALRVRSAANGESLAFEARYAVGCDGARSLVRRAIGSGKEDLGLHQPWLVADLLLRRPVDLPDYTVQYCDPAQPTTACYVVGNRRRWEIMLKPGDDPAEITRPARVWELLRRWITPADAELERSVVYTFHSVIAEGWRRGRLLIAGDAAHQTPPFAGQGLCTGVRDAANLAWKLAAVLRGRANTSLLDSYEPERRPHARAFIELAIRMGDLIQAIDPELAAARDRGIGDGGPELVAFPQPRLGPGLHAGAPPAGYWMPQPRLADGRLLDDVIGPRFSLLGSAPLIAAARDAAGGDWAALDAAVIPAADPAIAKMLSDLGVGALIVRPDRYVFGAAGSAAELVRLGADLRARLAAPAPGAQAADAGAGPA